MIWILVWIWWFFWAISRFYITKFSAFLFGSWFPWWTLLVNLLWSFMIWCLFAFFENVKVDTKIKSFLITWFLWALTTYSTFAMESFFMIDRLDYKDFLANISFNLIWTILFAGFGFYLVNFLFKKYAN